MIDELTLKRRKIIETEIQHLVIELRLKQTRLQQLNDEYNNLTKIRTKDEVIFEANNPAPNVFDSKEKYGFRYKTRSNKVNQQRQLLKN